MGTVGIVILVAIVVVVVWAVSVYNGLIQLKNLMQEAFSGIDVQLKRRHDLIPNLVSVVQGYQIHERQTLENVARLRTQIVSVSGDRPQMESELSRGLRSIFALAEAYPNLKADQNFAQLHQTLVQIEDELQMARRYYNGTVRNYNIQVQSFPSVIIAGQTGFKPAEFFEIEYATERQTPDVKWDKA